MATTAHTSYFPTALREQMDGLFAALGRGFNAYMERKSRADQIAALNAKSDAELAKMGIRRDRIAAHVFSDMFYV